VFGILNKDQNEVKNLISMFYDKKKITTEKTASSIRVKMVVS